MNTYRKYYYDHYCYLSLLLVFIIIIIIIIDGRRERTWNMALTKTILLVIFFFVSIFLCCFHVLMKHYNLLDLQMYIEEYNFTNRLTFSLLVFTCDSGDHSGSAKQRNKEKRFLSIVVFVGENKSMVQF